MRFTRIITLFFLALLTINCSGLVSHSEVDTLNEMEPSGSLFTQKLAIEYRDFANFEQNEMYDYADALHFARKGIMAAEGQNVLPEPLENWRISETNIEALSQQRERLMMLMDKGAREFAPMEASSAQFSYDCWIEQQEENWQTEDIAACRDQFYAAVENLENAMNEINPTIEKAEESDAEEILIVEKIEEEKIQESHIPIDEAKFLVFFDFDKKAIDQDAQDVIKAVAEEVKARDDVKTVVVVGYTDTSGPKAYNEKLSKQRAMAVKSALSQQGLAETMIRVDAMGETNLLVQTSNGKREASNRRVEIRFE